MVNTDVKKKIQNSRIKQWEIAEKLNISEFTFCRKLRKELTQEDKLKVLQAIKELKEKNKED